MKFPVIKRSTARLVRPFLFIALFSTLAAAQSSGVDLTYNGVPSLPLLPPNGLPAAQQQAVQADGKILAWGPALAAQGIAKGRILRLNGDGSLDNSFTYCNCGLDSFSNAAPLPEGKVLVAGSVGSSAKVIRLNSDGSLDPTFNFVQPVVTGGNGRAAIVAVAPDGKFFVARSWSQIGFSGTDIYHFNADGSSDASFAGVAVGFGSPNFSSLGGFELLPDGRFYVAINTSAPFSSLTSLRRYTAAGAVDPTWQEPGIGTAGPGGTNAINGIDAQADGSLLVAGSFTSVNGVPKTNIVRLLPAGNVDLTFTGPPSFRGTGVRVLANGKILFSAEGALGGGNRLVRLNPDGSIDITYVMDPAVDSIRNAWDVDANDRVVFSSGNTIVRLLANGTRDTSFNPNVSVFGRVHALARQADGKVIVAGEFTQFNGVASVPFVRTNADGTLDPTYSTGTGFNDIPARLAIQPDGRLLAIGPFTSYNGTAVPGIVRLLPSGAIDPTFSVTPNAGSTIAWTETLADGRIYIAGNFSSINGTARPGVARLNADGTLDTAFNALLGGSPNVTAVIAQPDGKVLIGGSFSGVSGFNRSGFVRVDANGVLDQSFNPTNLTAGRIYLTPDGKILTTSANAGDTITILRRNQDGTTDATFTSVVFQHTFNSGTTRIDDLLVRPDGSFIVVGFFNRVAGADRTGLVRLAPNGTLDQLFLPLSTNDRVRTAIDGGPGKVLIGGDFTRVERTSKAGLARLNVAQFHKVAPFDFDGDGRADVAVYRASTNTWYQLLSGGGPIGTPVFGIAGDVPVPADFDGDGKTDVAIWRPSSADWWYRSSANGGLINARFGAAGDVPRPSDFDGDGKADLVLFRPSANAWIRFGTLVGAQPNKEFGIAGDQPLVGDFDGDGKGDLAVFRPSTGDWWYAASASNGAFRQVHWGANGDIPVPADYDGDGKTDVAVFRPSDGGWYIYNSGSGTATTLAFGLAGDRPISADYDGDGKADLGVFRPSTGIWYVLQSTSGFTGVQWGISTDTAIEGAFLP